MMGTNTLVFCKMDAIKHTEMKSIIKKEYFRRMKRTLRSGLNGRNVILAINSWAVSVLRYGAGVINWTKAELQELDRKTRKTLTMHGALNPNSNVNRLYMHKNIQGRGLISAADCVNKERNSVAWYVKHTVEPFLQEVGRQGVVDTSYARDPNVMKAEVLKQHESDWMKTSLIASWKKR